MISTYKSREEKLEEHYMKSGKISKIAFKIVVHPLFDLFILMLVLVNVIVLMIDKYPLPSIYIIIYLFIY